jgi:hypothetical protein
VKKKKYFKPAVIYKVFGKIHSITTLLLNLSARMIYLQIIMVLKLNPTVNLSKEKVLDGAELLQLLIMIMMVNGL